MGNKKVEMTSSLSPQQQQIQGLLGGKISQGMNQPYQAYTGPIMANPDPLSLAAANMMMNYLGYGGYQLPNFQMGQQLPQQGGAQPAMGGQVPNQPQPQFQAWPGQYNPFKAQ